jgi:hypothetical protein
MRLRFGFILSALILLFANLSTVAQQPRNRAAQRGPAAGDLTIKYRTTMAGHIMESTSMIKGARERSESRSSYGGDSVNIIQCDLKRSIQLNDKIQKYLITPMQTQTETSADKREPEALTNSPAPARRGGVVTYTTTATDTGERKEMFGFTARHVKTSINIESSPEACNPIKQRMETDGWYIDLSAGLDCDLDRSQRTAYRPAPGGCRDETRFRRLGVAKTGYPLVETTTMYGPDGSVTFTSTKEVVELSRELLQASLFEIPAGYTEAQSSEEFYGTPAIGSMANISKESEAAQQSNRSEEPSSNARKPAGTLRIGVVPLDNKTGRTVSTENLRARLIGEIQGGGIEAIPLNAESQTAAEAEARAKQCDFILYTDISALKTPKLGGVFGRVTGVSGIAKTDSRLDFKLFAVGEATPRLQSSVSAKQEGDETSAGAAVSLEAQAVTAEVRKRARN